MNPDQRNQIIDAIELAMKQAGLDDMYSAANRLLAFVDSQRPYIAVSVSRSALDGFFASCGPSDRESCERFVAFVTSVYPIISSALIAQMQKVIAEIPTKPGPPIVTTPQLKRRIIEYVSTLNKAGVKLGEAQERTAQKFDIGKRTVQRVWRERKKMAEQPFQTEDDLFDFLLNRRQISK